MAGGSDQAVQLAVAAMCVLLVMVRSATAAAVRPQPYTLDEVTPSNPAKQSMNTLWASGPVLLYDNDGELVSVNMETKALDTLVPKEVFAKNGVVRAEISVDKEYVLLAYDAEKEFRHGASARYMAYRINDERQNKVKGGGGFTRGDSKTIQIGGGKRLQLAKWGTRGSQIAYVYENNIYYLPSPGAEPVKITSDGVPDIVFNGVLHSYADALSSHPVNTVGKDGALQFSPDGGKLLFARTDVSAVKNATFVHYGTPGGMDNQYAHLVTFRYAKAGTPMASVSLRVAPLPSEPCPCVNVQQLLAPVDVVSEDHYLEAMAWVNDATVMAWWMNRAANVRQDVIYILSRDLKEIPGAKGLTIEQKNGWVDVYPPVFQKGSQTTTYVTILWQPNENNISFPHVVKVKVNSTKAITSGDFTVTKIHGWAANGTIYYEASEVDQPSSRQVFAVEEGGEPRCLSCDFTSPEDNSCRRAAAYFNHDLDWYAVTCKGPDPPFTAVFSTAHPAVKKLTSTNLHLRKILKSKQLPQQQDDWVPVEGGASAHVRMLLPPDLPLDGSEKRPAVVCVDGSPGSQVIEDTFGVDLFTYLTTYRRYIVIFIDGRGSGGRGDRWLFSVYRNLGTVEVADQITVTRYLTMKYPFIDGSRVGITGRGYGGYAAAMALARDDDHVFKCAVSVAPITSWIYTDVSLSERYMGFPTPEDNEEGYSASDVTRLADRFAGKTFLLMHGTADDDVLYQHSMALATALQDAGVLFEQQSYPDEAHWMRSLQLHAYQTIDDFFVRCFDRTPLLVAIIQELIS